VRDRRQNQCSVILKADEAAVEQVIDTRRQQQAILAIQSLVIAGIPPRLAVTGDQMLDALDAGDSAALFERQDPLLEKSLPAARPDDRLFLGW
jgi:hypothetical protein